MGRDQELTWCADAFLRHRVLAIYGLAGIGKTSLMLTAAHRQALRVAGTAAYHVCEDGERIGGVLAALLAGDHAAASAAIPLRDALDRIVEWARRTPLILCIDDAHRICDPLLPDVLAHLGAAAPSLWLALASRRRLPMMEHDIDSAVLRLGPLSTEAARALWCGLERRFGPSVVRFEALDAGRLGSPFALRRAFATGMAREEEGVDLSALDPRQAALLAQLCAFAGPVEVDRLAALVPDLVASLPGLLQALLVDIPEAGALAVHDLVRASVVCSPRPPGGGEHSICLAYYQGAGGRDLLALLRHTVGAGEWAAAGELIDRVMRPHYGFFPLGAATETQVLAAFAAVERAHVELPLPLRLARLQLMARRGDGRAVLEQLSREAACEPAAWAHLATVELLLGDAPAAERHVRRALADPSVAERPVARAFLLAVLLEVLRRQGRIDALHGEMESFQRFAAQLGPIGVGVAQVMTAAISYDQENYEDAAARLASVRPCISLLRVVPAVQATHALLERAACAALVATPDDAPSRSAVARPLFEDVLFLRGTLLLFAADGDVFEGNVSDAEARARDAEAIADRGGYHGIRQWAVYVRAQCLRIRGLAASSRSRSSNARSLEASSRRRSAGARPQGWCARPGGSTCAPGSPCWTPRSPSAPQTQRGPSSRWPRPRRCARSAATGASTQRQR